MKSTRGIICAIVLVLFLASLTACNKTTTREAIRRQIEYHKSPWSVAVAPRFRSQLSRFVDAPVYRRHLAYDPKSLTLTGTHEALFTNTTDHPLDTLYMRTVAEVWGPGKDAFALTDLQVDGKPAEFTMGKTLIAIPMAKPLAPGQSTRITYATRATLPTLDPSQSDRALPTGNDGFYGAGPDVTGLSDFPMILPDGDRGKEIEWPNLAALPSYPISLHEIWLTIPQDWTVIALGNTVGEQPARDGQKTVHAVAVMGRTGLLVTRTAVKQTQQVGDVQVTAYVPPALAPFSESLLKNTADALKVYEEVYWPVPLTKVDVVAMPLYSYAGSYWGGVLALDPRNITAERIPAPDGVDPALIPLLETDRPRRLRRVVFHEMAHAWWGELVEPDTATLPWFTEALANASALYALDQVDGLAAGEYWRTYFAFQYQKQRILGMADAPLNQPAKAYKDWDQRTTLTYYKGGLFYDQLRRLVGDQQFFLAMRAFLQKHPYETVAEPGPVADLMDQPGVAALYRRWVEEAHGDEDLGVFQVKDFAIRKQLGLPPW